MGVKLLPFVWSFSSAFNPFLKLLPSFFRGKIVAFCVKLQFSLESWGRGDMQQPERERGRERESYNERNIRIFYPYNVLQWKREKCKNISFWERELRKMSIVLSMAFVSTLLNQKWGSFDLTKGRQPYSRRRPSTYSGPTSTRIYRQQKSEHMEIPSHNPMQG